MRTNVELFQLCFLKKNCQLRYHISCLRKRKSYFVKKIPKKPKLFYQNQKVL